MIRLDPSTCADLGDVFIALDGNCAALVRVARGALPELALVFVWGGCS